MFATTGTENVLNDEGSFADKLDNDRTASDAFLHELIQPTKLDYSIAHLIWEKQSVPLMIKNSIGFIVCGLMFRVVDGVKQILLMQEAKQESYGKWYLPAGRMEVGESIEDGLKREVLEESGLHCEPISLCCVEIGACHWYRFSFFVRHTGGSLKTLEQADKESLQAQFFPVDDVLAGRVPLRYHDILYLVRQGLAPQAKAHVTHCDWMERIMPSKVLCPALALRFIVYDETNHRILLDKRLSTNVNGTVPLVPYSTTPAVHLGLVINKFLKPIFSPRLRYESFCPGVLALSCDFLSGNNPEYGCCFTLIGRLPCGTNLISDMFVWKHLTAYEVSVLDKFWQCSARLRCFT